MGFIRNIFTGTPDLVTAFAVAEHGPAFVVDEQAIPAQIFGLDTYESVTAPAPRISRREAIQVPAVKRVRDLIAATLGGLPLDVVDVDNVERVNDLLTQPERSTPRSVSVTRLIEDMLLEGVAYWLVVERNFDGYPRFVRRVTPDRVSINEDTGAVWVNGRATAPRDLLQFESPNDALLIAGARAIRTCLKLDAASALYADGAPPLDYFTPADGADPADDDDVQEILNGWKAARQRRSTGYVPAALKYNVAGWSPEQLQLHDARQHAVLEIARLSGIDPEELGVSTTSRTYANQFDRRKAFIDFSLGAYRQAVEDRLSMGDVTKRGYRVKFNLDAFLRSDAKTRMETYQLGLQVGAYEQDEIRALENKPPLTELPAAPTVTTTQEADAPVTNARFANEPDIAVKLDAPAQGAQFSVDLEKRTIRGLAVPYGVSARSGGKTWQFAKGVLKYSDVSRVKLLAGHDWTQAIGRAVALDDTDDGLIATFSVARGAEGDRALVLAEDGVWDGLSVGLGVDITFEERDGVHFATSAPLAEVSLTPCPAYDDARVSSVAASSDITKEIPMADEVTTEPVTEPVNLDNNHEPTGPTLVTPVAPATFVDEAPLYRFDGIEGQHDFSSDLIAGLRDGDHEAKGRALGFIQENLAAPTFDVDRANVTTLNPTRQRPDLYVDRLVDSNPLYAALYKGTLADSTPFVFPKFGSAAGLVADHVEGVEPTPGSFTATSQTVTPSAVSGKVEITREVWDQGGSPQVSALIWREMTRQYYSALEGKAFKLLNDATPAQIALSGTDDVLVNDLEDAIADLQFTPNGEDFTFMPTAIDLYKALVKAVDADGRKLLPVLNPSNASGQAASRFRSLLVAGVQATPAKTLGAANSGASSYLLDPDSVHVWNSTPQRLDFQYRVAYVDLAIWGYCATAISRLDGVREVTYTA